MEILIKALQFIASFSLLVLVHELGHFMFARMFGIRVEKFYLFFNPWFSVAKFTYKGTEYGIGWLPLGGYCKIAGMIDESMDAQALKEPPKPDEFRSRPAWQRLLVMTGGVIMNIVMAVVLYIGMSYTWGREYIPNAELTQGSAFSDLAHDIGFRDGDRIVSVDGRQIEEYAEIFPAILLDKAGKVEVLRDGKTQIITIDDKARTQMVDNKNFMFPRISFVVGGLVKGGNAAAAGLQTGDRILAVEGDTLQWYNQFVKVFAAVAGKSVHVTVERSGEEMTLPVAVDKDGKIGVYNAAIDSLPSRTLTFTFAQSIPEGFRVAGNTISGYWKQLRMIFKAYDSVGGLGTIANLFPSHWSWLAFWHITAFLSIVLAIMNIIPVPGLDGGHVMFVLYEMITRRKPSDKFLETATTIGLLLILTLLVLANGNDIYRFLIK